MLESAYQAKLIKQLRRMFPGCVVLKNDTAYMQGVPDLTILYQDMWAMLEVKASEDSAIQPNQEYYVHMLNRMSYAAFIHPDNEVDVLRDLQQTFESSRHARVPQR